MQTLLVRLPLAYYMSVRPGANLTGIGLAAPVSTFAGVALCVVFYVWMEREEKRSLV